MTGARLMYYNGGPMQPANNGQPAEQGKKIRLVHSTEQVAHLWANGVGQFIRNAAETASTSADGRILYSYSQEIAARTDVRDADGRRVFLMNANARESTTTQRHVRNADRAIPFRVSYCSSTSTADGWDGRRDTIADASYLWFSSGADKAPTELQTLCFPVRYVDAVDPVSHRANYRDLFNRAVNHGREMMKRREHFYPAFVAQNFRLAAEYRAVFCPDAEDLGDAFDWEAQAAGFAKARARKEKAKANEEARSASYRREETEWMRACAPTLTDLAAILRTAPVDGETSSGLRAAVARYEAEGVWDTETPSAPTADRVRQVLVVLIANGADAFCDAAERVGFKVLPAFSLPVDGAIRPPCAALVRGYPKSPKRVVFGRTITEYYSNVAQVYDAVGIRRYDCAVAYRSARLAIGRDLLFVRAGGDEVITSGGARVPLGIIAALWRRHGGEVIEAALAPYALTFPTPRRVGSFTWIGYDLGDSAAAATDGGASVLTIGCHKVAAADVVRLARRLGWPEPEAEASA